MIPVQAVVGALIMHINNGGSGEVDRALSLLLDLVHTHFTTMQRFAVLIKVLVVMVSFRQWGKRSAQKL